MRVDTPEIKIADQYQSQSESRPPKFTRPDSKPQPPMTEYSNQSTIQYHLSIDDARDVELGLIKELLYMFQGINSAHFVFPEKSRMQDAKVVDSVRYYQYILILVANI